VAAIINLHRLQAVMYAAARLVTNTGRYEHIIHHSLWHSTLAIPVQQRIIFKIAVLAFHGTCPIYLLQRCLHAVSSHTWTHQPASCWSWWPSVPSTKTKIDGRGFFVATLNVWNSLYHFIFTIKLSPKNNLNQGWKHTAYTRHLSSENYWRVNLLAYLIT